MIDQTGTIELTDRERLLLEQIDFDPPSHDHEIYRANSARVTELMESLIERDGIPQHRVSWFVDPDNKRGKIKDSREVSVESLRDDGRRPGPRRFRLI